MARLPTFSGDLFSWKDSKGTSSTSRIRAAAGSLARGFYIKSQRTGDVRLFLYDAQAMEDNEFFDGEALAFMSPGNGLTVQVWTGR